MSNYGSEPIRGTHRTLLKQFKALQDEDFIRSDLVAENLDIDELKHWISVGRHLGGAYILSNLKSKKISKRRSSKRRNVKRRLKN